MKLSQLLDHIRSEYLESIGLAPYKAIQDILRDKMSLILEEMTKNDSREIRQVFIAFQKMGANKNVLDLDAEIPQGFIFDLQEIRDKTNNYINQDKLEKLYKYGGMGEKEKQETIKNELDQKNQEFKNRFGDIW